MTTPWVDARGRVTLFVGAQPVAVVNKRGKSTPVVRSPVWSKVRTIHFVEGVTLNRVSIIQSTHAKQRMQCIVRKASAAQIDQHCDTCPKVHRSTNPSCSATLKLNTFASKPGHLYSIKTRRDQGAWRSSTTFLGASKTGNATYTKLS